MTVGKQESAKYMEVLQSYLITFAETQIGVSWRLQHENATINKSRLTVEWLTEKQVRVMDPPARSSDLNPDFWDPTEKLWGILAI